MTTPPPQYPPHPQHQPYTAPAQPPHGYAGYPPPYQAPQYPMAYPSGQYPIPPQRTPPPPRRKGPRFGLGARIATIITAVVVVAVAVVGIGIGVGTSRSTPTASTTTAPTRSPTTSAPARAAAPAPTTAATTAAPTPPAPARAITARDWAKIAKDPDAHIGESVIVYGEVTQFDAATGTSTFRANVDGVKHPLSYGYADYDTNTVLTASGADVSDLVQKDLFKAEATVTGSVSYETTMGGTLTAPQLGVVKITVIGTAK